MSRSIPEGNVFVMSTSEELRFRGMDCKSPQLISVTLYKHFFNEDNNNKAKRV